MSAFIVGVAILLAAVLIHDAIVKLHNLLIGLSEFWLQEYRRNKK